MASRVNWAPEAMQGRVTESPFRLAAVIPCYRQADTLKGVLESLRALGIRSYVVDDGNEPEESAAILAAVRSVPGTCYLPMSRNRGKGAAVTFGIEALSHGGYTHALQIDADGQHDIADAPRLIEDAKHHPDALISGLPQYDDSAPRGRVIGRYITHFWVWIETLSSEIRDSMCGYRVYPVQEFLTIARNYRIGRRMDFDTEIMVRYFWDGKRIRFIPTRVRYPEGGVSNFDYFRDNVRISLMHTKLVLESPLHWLARLRRPHDGP